MQILAHRGFWQNHTNLQDSPLRNAPNPQNLIHQNSLESFECAFANGFGIETDLRDLAENLVISHDMPTLSAINAKQLFALYHNANYSQASQYAPTLALNIKADGLAQILQNLLITHKITNYFCFDMSVPDMRIYADLGLNFFTRQSEIEKDLPFYSKAQGVWCDEFYESWISEKVILGHLGKGKQVAIVSPELHKRDFKSAWIHYKKILDSNALLKNPNILLCTDFPQLAKEFFK